MNELNDPVLHLELTSSLIQQQLKNQAMFLSKLRELEIFVALSMNPYL